MKIGKGKTPKGNEKECKDDVLEKCFPCLSKGNILMWTEESNRILINIIKEQTTHNRKPSRISERVNRDQIGHI